MPRPAAPRRGGRRAGRLLALALASGALASAAAVGADPEFTEAYLADRAHIAEGKQLFKQQCARCHGRSAYPGKAPRLKPKRMDPLEIYDKMTYGFGKMPAWEDVFTDEQRMAITAYMKSRNFSN